MKSRFLFLLSSCTALLAAFVCLPMTLQGQELGKVKVRTYVQTIPEILEKSPQSDWTIIPDENIVLFEMKSGTVALELAPFASPEHVAQLRALIRAGYYDASAVVRVQENYVVELGDPTETRSIGKVSSKLAKETTFKNTLDLGFLPLDGSVDTYAPHVGFIDSFPVGTDQTETSAWLLHCHGVTGAVQDDPKTTPGGTFLYTAIGNPARELDGKLAVVGRVIEGISLWTTLPRGEGVYGFLPKDKYVPILRTRLASDVPADQRIRFEKLRTDSKTFAEVLKARRGGFEDAPSALRPIDVCSIPLPIRRVASSSAKK